MLENPRFVESQGEVMWFYVCEPRDVPSAAGIQDWFVKNIKSKRNTCTLLDPPDITISRTRPRDDSVLISGVCGTSVFTIHAFDAPAVERQVFGEERGFITGSNRTTAGSASIQSRLKDGSLRTVAALVTTPLLPPIVGPVVIDPNYWPQFDDLLNGQPGRLGGIDFHIFEAEETVYAHIELGSSEVFAYEYHRNGADLVGFARWLVSGKKVPRKVYSIDSAGVSTELKDLLPENIVVNLRSDTQVQRPYFARTPPCMPPCMFGKSCSIGSGTLQEFFAGNAGSQDGYAVFDLEIIVLKPYCVDSSGNPCPPPP